MKKILLVLALLTLLAVLIVPQIASAQGPPECCRIRRTITVDTQTAFAGVTVGSPGGYCPFGVGVNILGQRINVWVPGVPVLETENWGIFCLINTVNTVVDWIFVFLIALTVLFVIFGAIQILTAAGAPEKTTSGRNYILYAAIGLVLAFFAKAVPSIVKAVMGY